MFVHLWVKLHIIIVNLFEEQNQGSYGQQDNLYIAALFFTFLNFFIIKQMTISKILTMLIVT